MKIARIITMIAYLSINSIFAGEGFEHLSKEAQGAVHKMPAVMQEEFKNKDSVTAHAVLEQLEKIADADENLRNRPQYQDALKQIRSDAINEIMNVCSSNLCKNCKDPLEKYACEKEVREYCRTLENNGWLSKLYSWIHAESTQAKERKLVNQLSEALWRYAYAREANKNK
ncbi:MAG: hypothetical protein WCE21_03595 [Candidatus Babeliales bacterium]